MNSHILKLLFHPLVIGFIIGYIITIKLYIWLSTIWFSKRKVYEKSTICPICEKETKDQDPHYFRRDGELYRVHRGACTHEFLYSDLFGDEIKNE